MLELAEEANNDGKYKNQFVDYIDEIPDPDDDFTIDDPTVYKTIKDLIKINVKNFYSYKGSLTTPP